MAEDLIEKMLAGNTAALARLISRVERGGPDAPRLMERVRPRLGRAHIVGVTGAPGSGKSTLVDGLVAHLRAQGRKVGILAVDPSSPFTGGALLGDRLRMRRHYTDPGVFIRSMATRGATGGLSLVARRAVKLLDAAGFDVVFLETVGVGQTELAVMAAVDTLVVVTVPEGGDAIQTMKAGLLEAAHVLVVNKADHTGAKRMAADLEMAVMMGPPDAVWTVPVLLTQAHRQLGISELWQAVESHRHALAESGRLEALRRDHRRQEFFDVVQEGLARRLRQAIASDGHLGNLLGRVERGEADPYFAAEQALADPRLLRQWFAEAEEDEDRPPSL